MEQYQAITCGRQCSKRLVVAVEDIPEHKPKVKSRERRKTKFSLFARVPTALESEYQKLAHSLEVCGFKSMTEWMLHCMMLANKNAECYERWGKHA